MIHSLLRTRQASCLPLLLSVLLFLSLGCTERYLIRPADLQQAQQRQLERVRAKGMDGRAETVPTQAVERPLEERRQWTGMEVSDTKGSLNAAGGALLLSSLTLATFSGLLILKYHQPDENNPTALQASMGGLVTSGILGVAGAVTLLVGRFWEETEQPENGRSQGRRF